MRFSAADHEQVTRAVATAERETDGEIVTIVAARSDNYHDAGLHWAIGATFLVLSLVAVFPGWWAGLLDGLLGGWGHGFTAGQYMTALLVLLILVFLIVRYLFAVPALRMAGTPRSTKARRVRRRAVDLFRVSAERRTRGRTGILIYLSLAEHRAEIVADAAITGAVEDDVWGDAMAALIERVRTGQPGEGMAAAVTAVGAVLARHFPKSVDNPNELPDRLIEL